MDSIAITDHGVMYGCVEFYKQAVEQGIKPILGCEVYVAPRTRFQKEPGIDNKYNHLILLAKNNEGYKNLSKMVSIGFTEGYYYKPRIDLETIEKYHEGVICLSACLAGSVNQAILNGDMQKAEERALWFKNVFKDDYSLHEWFDIMIDTEVEQGNRIVKKDITDHSYTIEGNTKSGRCFYSKATCDIEFLFPFGWGELWGIADRTDYDLKKHAEHSGTDMSYLDPTTNEKYIPYCIEPSLGADRVALAFLVDAYDEEELEGGDVRTVMHLHPALAPYKAAVLPLSKKLSDKADEVYSMLAKKFNVEYDETGSIGKRYRRQDEIGTPFCITVDFETENDGCVTIRHRDSMTQERVEISKLTHFIAKSLEF